MERLHAIVYGRVQGVNFRSATVRRAAAYGLLGWVRNLSDGSVEVVAEGERAALESFLSFLHEGPPSAEVTRVEARWLPPEGNFSDFRVRF